MDQYPGRHDPWTTAEPLHPVADIWQVKLHFWAQGMAARFNAPVYLVGSALYKDKPRDIDIRIPVSDDDFRARYHVEPERWRWTDRGQRWIDDMAKIGSEITCHQRLNIDFQVWPESAYEEFANTPSVLLAAPTGKGAAQSADSPDGIESS